MNDVSELRRPLFSLRRDWPLIVAWPLIGALSLVIAGVARMLAGNEVAWQRLVWGTVSWSEWALLVPLIIVMARRFPLSAGRAGRSAGAHIAAATCVWLLHSTMVYLSTLAIFGSISPPGVTLREDLTWRLPVWLLYDTLIYITTAAATAAVDLHYLLAARSSRQAQLQMHVAEAELELMQMQAQPEFILRTLAAARSYAVTEPRRCESLVARLADVLRASLEGVGEERAPLDSELRHVKNWLAVDALRTDRRIDLNIESDGDASDREIPRYLVSELVSSTIAAVPEQAPVSITIEVVAIGDLFALRLRLEGDGMAHAAAAPLERVQQHLALHGRDEWSVQVDERSGDVVAVTFDQMRGVDEPLQPSDSPVGGGLLARA